MSEQPYRVMVVDDEGHVRGSISPLLEKYGYCVSSFGNAADALAAFRQGGCDLILSDVKMPGMDGIELLKHVREFAPDVPVILMTAYANLDMAIEAIKKGAFDFIIKPFDPEVLLSAISKGIRFHQLCKLEKDYKIHLEEAIAQKSHELEAVYSQAMLSEKMAAIGLLSAGVAHEINNPVTFIFSNLENLSKYITRMTDFMNFQTETIKTCCSNEVILEVEKQCSKNKVNTITEDIQNLVEESRDGTERIKNIVASLRNFSRNDEQVLVEANLNSLIESTLTIVWHEIKYVATIHRELSEIPPIMCYPSELGQVIMNLLVNAAHAIDKGPGTIGIRTWSDNDAAYLAVSDDGCGISPEILDRIFIPFFTTKEVGKGTGLGLSISYEIVKKHHGEILVDSIPGQGTTFTVKLPFIHSAT